MKNSFFRYPHTPHLLWLGEGTPRDDKILSQAQLEDILHDQVIVEEKVDGTNLGVSLAVDGSLQVQRRGQYLSQPYQGEFRQLKKWLDIREKSMRKIVKKNLILFGEWCAARHSISYTALPDLFLFFDVYDRDQSSFWSTEKRDALAEELHLAKVPTLFRGTISLVKLQNLLFAQQSCFYPGPVEGLIVRRESEGWLASRAKIVRTEFSQGIDEHWRTRPIEWNRIDWKSSPFQNEDDGE